MKAFKERPLLMCGEMVRATLAGRKTQMRRVIKIKRVPLVCPHGKAGDRLWIRETWGACEGGFIYAADEGPN